MSNKLIKVRFLKPSLKGEIGVINESEFNDAKHEKVVASKPTAVKEHEDKKPVGK